MNGQRQHDGRNGNGGRRGRRWLRVWHRRLGLLTAVFVLLLAVTGMLLSHADDLNLADIRLGGPVIDAWYDRGPKTEPVGFPTSLGWLIWQDGRLYLDGRAMSAHLPRPRGALAAGGLLAVAAEQEVLILTETGALVERMNGASLPGPIQQLGKSPNGGLIIRTAAGLFAAERDFLSWSARTDTEVAWVEPASSIPAQAMSAVRDARSGDGVSLQRLLLDLHTGRIVGAWGAYVMDAVALLFIILAVTGIVFWARSNGGRNGRRGHRRLR